MYLQQTQLHPSLACHAQFYKDKQTTSHVSCLPIIVVAALSPGYTENITAGEENTL